MIWRIRDRSTFVELRDSGSRIRRGPIIVTYSPDFNDEPPRVAFALGRRLGGAVARNQLRRRLRAVMAELASNRLLAPGAYLLSATPDATSLSYEQLHGWLSTAVADVITLRNRLRTGAR